jgi:hypothetical protein
MPAPTPPSASATAPSAAPRPVRPPRTRPMPFAAPPDDVPHPSTNRRARGDVVEPWGKPGGTTR